jgi:mitochondrial FAD-linked sulfhydryl oxidase
MTAEPFPDMDDCGICDGINRWAQQAQRAAFQTPEIKEQISSSENPLNPENKNSLSSSLPCPPDYYELGQATWTFLHTMAAYYKPSTISKEQDEKDMKEFFRLLGKFYPCKSCADDFTKDLAVSPPKTSSNSSLSYWLCQMHNKVNEKLGKPIFDCSRALERWRYGSKDCQEPPS